MRTIILSLFSRSFFLLAPVAKRQDACIGKDSCCDFPPIQVSNKNPSPMSQNRVKWKPFLKDRTADSLNSGLLFKDWTPILHLIAK